MNKRLRMTVEFTDQEGYLVMAARHLRQVMEPHFEDVVVTFVERVGESDMESVWETDVSGIKHFRGMESS